MCLAESWISYCSPRVTHTGGLDAVLQARKACLNREGGKLVG